MGREQSINRIFCFKLQKSAKEIHEMLKLVYGDAAVTMKRVYKWFERFRNGCESVEDMERSGRPSTSKTQENDGIVRAEFVPRNTTVNSEYYKGLLEHLRNDARRKRPEK